MYINTVQAAIYLQTSFDILFNIMAGFTHLSQIIYVFLMALIVPCLSGAKVHDCYPWKGKAVNSTRSVTLLVKEFYEGMSNMYSYGVRKISKANHVVYSNTIKVTLDFNVDRRSRTIFIPCSLQMVIVTVNYVM